MTKTLNESKVSNKKSKSVTKVLESDSSDLEFITNNKN